MALLFNKISPNGIQAEYHRVASFSYNSKYGTIYVESYVSEAFRELEKTNIELMIQLHHQQELQQQFYKDTATHMELTDQEIQYIENICNEIERLQNLVDLDYSRIATLKTFDYYNESICSLSDAYNYLKTLPEFQDATDC